MWHQTDPHCVILGSMPISGEPAKHVEVSLRVKVKLEVKFPLKLPANIWKKDFLKPVLPDHYIKYLWTTAELWQLG